MNLSEQLATTVSQLNELVATNAAPTAEMIGRLAQWKAGGSLITDVVIEIAAIAGILLGKKLIKKNLPNLDNELQILAGGCLCIFSTLFCILATVELLQKGPLWIAALTDWKVALAAQIMRML